MILGGAQENTLLSCEGLHKRGHKVTLITGPALGPEGQLLDRAHSGGYGLLVVEHLRRAISPREDVRAYQALKRLIFNLEPEIVHTHSAKAGIIGRCAADFVQKKISRARRRTTKKPGTNYRSGGRRPHIVHTIHGLAFHPYQSWHLNRLYIAAEKHAARRTDAFISVAEAMTEKALAAGIGRPEQFNTIFSGLEVQNYIETPRNERIAQIRQEMNIPANAVVIATVARLFALKGHEFIVESAREVAAGHPNVFWLFIGDGNLRAQLRHQIARVGLEDRFRLIGLVTPGQVGELIHTSDILLHCSLREGLPRALPQALLCGKPVISFDIDGAPEVVIEDRTGILVKPIDIEGLVKAQIKLIDDPDLRKCFGNNGREMCRQEFDHQRMVDKIEALYNSLVLRD